MAREYLSSPIGLLVLEANDRAVTRLAPAEAAGPACPSALTQRGAALLARYFAGERVDFDLPLAPGGTAFQQRVWRALAQTGWGETTTYGALAAAAGAPGAARAVGNALGRNPILILIPCHRVLAAHGLGGFAYGPAAKATLLTLEGRGKE